MTEDEVQQKKAAELDKRREEEMQVEVIRKQMYLAGQATRGTDSLNSSSIKVSAATQHMTKEQKTLFEEQQNRKKAVKQQHAAALMKEEEDDSDLEDSKPQLAEAEQLAKLAKSETYREDVHVKGHESVWGSFYAKDEERWGFVCCKSLERNKRCPLAPEEEEEKIAKPKADRGPRGKRRRRGGGGAQAEGAPAGGEQAAASSAAASSSDATAQPPPPANAEDAHPLAGVPTTIDAAIAAEAAAGNAGVAGETKVAMEPATSVEELPPAPT